MDRAVFDAIINVDGVAYKTRLYVDVVSAPDVKKGVFLSGSGHMVESSLIPDGEIFGSRANDELGVMLVEEA